MSKASKLFDQKSQIKSEDFKHKSTIQFNIGKYQTAFSKGKQKYNDLNLAKNIANEIKKEAIENLAEYLQQFESNSIRNGAEVVYATNANEAIECVLAICKENNTSLVVKSKSMVTEEIHLNHHLEQNHIESIETDLGEYIQQLDGEPPYHIVTPAMHKSKEDIAKLFHEKLSYPPNLAPEQLTLIARELLRKKFTEAQIGVTGGNFLIADIGGVAITENEGNARLTTSFPKIHIAIVGIEKMIPSIKDLNVMWPLLSTFGTGQEITVYNTILTGPQKNDEIDGPEKMYVILLDNGRTDIYANPKLRESLYCIRCGACLNTCPVYKNIGGHAYQATYSGPIGSVISPHLFGIDEYNHLSNASTLCGQCSEVCPVKIPIHDMLHYNRELIANKPQKKNSRTSTLENVVCSNA